MHSDPPPSSMVLICDELGVIQKIINNDLGLEGLLPGYPLGQFVDSTSRVKLLNFLAELSLKGTAFDWEINILKAGERIALRVAGALDQQNLMIVFAHTPLMALSILDELMKINNEQATTLRNVYKNHLVSVQNQENKDVSMLEEITHINNELATLQRDLMKKIIEQEKINAEIRRLNEELDLRLQDRNKQLIIANQKLEEKVVQLEETERSQRKLSTKYRIVADNTYDWEYWLDGDGQYN